MSGFERSGVFGLTATKAKYWHGVGQHYGSGCPRRGDLAHIVADHLLPAGFVVVKDGRGSYVELTGPGLDEEKTGALYTAISGQPARPE